ncbi:MAG: helix-turn-helix transcriptional regulator [Chloroflexi bacterium]|nr:helix-turn-helix transcriptional regulator [Chloroflexota bacterium]
MSMELLTLKKYIEDALRFRSLNGRSLAERAGVAPSTLGPLLRGKIDRVDVNVLYRISAPLGLPFESLCRVAVGLPPVPEGGPFPPEADAVQLMALYDSLRGDPERQARFLDVVRAAVALSGALNHRDTSPEGR